MSICKVCNCELGEVPMCFGANSPASLIVPENEYEARVEENSEQCIVDGEHFFVRGHIELAVKNSDETFIWSVWVSLSEQSFSHMSENWDLEGREKSAPYFGWLMTNLPCYPETLHLKTSVQTQPVGCVPLIELEPSDHQLSLEQAHGITMDRVHEIAHQVMQH
ncbi:DUF2199 domain-containing protein [Vibrio antiquarius]|uniref:DUF2199 domain-containing protein n=1 Tax=Vibrio rotiferianus TaxID=190895 RepID=A0ABX3D5R3_9VIBR|nr:MULTISPECIES: DUF2199 domain-containing protein [Vibrio harveyi group]OHY90629.1 hypothetical protein BI375_22985 [Vibrio rotiferianus]HCH5096009.1 DUF2199 domain-containing protein [Vibrio parahaemolyticus]